MSDVSLRSHRLESRITPENPAALDAPRAARTMEAAASAFALVARAAGRAAGAQKNRLVSELQRHRLLARISRAEILAEIARHDDNFSEDSEVAEEIAIDTLTVARGCASQANVVRAAARAALSGVTLLPGQMRALATIEIVLRGKRAPSPALASHAGKTARGA